jgi:surface protein
MSIIKILNLSNFNSKNVTHMNFLFNGCSSLEKLDISNFNTEK